VFAHPWAGNSSRGLNHGAAGHFRFGDLGDEERDMIGLLAVLLVIWLVCVVLGIVIKGEFWLVIVGAVLFVATGVVGFVKREALGRRR
jgi:hypothetical protein